MKTKVLIILHTLACLLAMPATAQVNYAISGNSAYVVNSEIRFALELTLSPSPIKTA